MKTMQMYEIEQYELHAMKYRVQANSKAETIAKLLKGEAEPVDGTLEYIEVADDYGLAANENRDLADELLSLSVSVNKDVIPSIRSIEMVETD